MSVKCIVLTQFILLNQLGSKYNSYFRTSKINQQSFIYFTVLKNYWKHK